MKQFSFFKISDEEWKFLKTFKWAKEEKKKWIKIHSDFLKLKIEFKEQLLKLEKDLDQDVISFENIKLRKRILESLADIENKDWILDQIEDIQIWIEFNSERASRIN
tara:strand:+ start:920 stop:1240 length:321 start_codon:yes stop_codon:yes gene_type:complete